MPQQYKIGKYNTTVRMEDNTTIVTLYNTDIVKVSYDSIILNTGGWDTPTTKTRMNQTSNQFNLGFRVYQKNYSWFVDYNGETLQFSDNKITLRRLAH
jgi:hypothetical protein